MLAILILSQFGQSSVEGEEPVTSAPGQCQEVGISDLTVPEHPWHVIVGDRHIIGEDPARKSDGDFVRLCP